LVGIFYYASVVELVDTLDLKSNDHWVVRVQVPPEVQLSFIDILYKLKIKETIMETFIYILIGIVSAVFTFSVGYSVIGVVRGNRRQQQLEDRIFQLELDLGNLHRELQERIDFTELRIDRDIEEQEIRFNSQLDSRLDKLETKIKKQIPPTNDELLERIKQIEEQSYRMRMNM
jgi:hypothetical protein